MTRKTAIQAAVNLVLTRTTTLRQEAVIQDLEEEAEVATTVAAMAAVMVTVALAPQPLAESVGKTTTRPTVLSYPLLRRT